MPDHATTHDWQRVTALNGDQGWQCSRCCLTAISLPVHRSLDQCPQLAEAAFKRGPPDA